MQHTEDDKIHPDLMNIAKILIGGMLVAFVFALVLMS